MNVDVANLLLVHQGKPLNLNESASSNGLSSGSTIQCINLNTEGEDEETSGDVSNGTAS